MALQEKLFKSPKMLWLPQTVQNVQLFFSCSPRLSAAGAKTEMLTIPLGELSTLPRYSRKVQPLVDGSQTQKAFLLLLACCKGWTWLESSFSSHMAWAEHELGWQYSDVEVCCVLCWYQYPAVHLSSAQVASYSSIAAKRINLHQCPVKWIIPAYAMLHFTFPL